MYFLSSFISYEFIMYKLYATKISKYYARYYVPRSKLSKQKKNYMNPIYYACKVKFKIIRKIQI